MKLGNAFRLTLAMLLLTFVCYSAEAQNTQSASPEKKANPIQSFMSWGKSLMGKSSEKSEKPPTIAARGVSKATFNRQVNANQRPTIIELEKNEKLSEIVAATRGTVIVDFHASWCGPCKTQAKVLKGLEEVAAKNGARIVKIDVDTHAELAKQLKIDSLPTLMVIKNGALVGMQSGLATREALTAHLTQ